MNKGECGPTEPLFGISAVERDTGLAKDVLRVWERRYGFPTPSRDANGNRTYPEWQIEKLRIIRTLIDQGHRPAKIIALPISELILLLERNAPADHAHDGVQSPFIACLQSQTPWQLNGLFQQALMRMGLERFVMDIAAPLCATVGEQWAQGRLEIHEEHLFTEQLSLVLRHAIAGLPLRPEQRPRVLLTTFPQESHSLGLLMAEALLALGGCGCTSLGTQMPVPDIVRAADVHRPDIIALSFSSWYPQRQLLDGLADLRRALPQAVEIWAGGANAALDRLAVPGVRRLERLGDIATAVGAWQPDRA